MYRYINTEGGSAYTGTCAMSLLSDTDFKFGNTTQQPVEVHVEDDGTVMIGEFESTPDKCPDFTGGATLIDFAFAPLRLRCADNNTDGLLDFDVAVAWGQTDSKFYCSPESESTWPIPGAPSKCWKADTRFNVNVTVCMIMLLSHDWFQ